MQMPAKGQGSNQASQKKKGTTKTGCANHMQITEAPTGAPVMAGMFLANGYPATILFDSRASYMFISTSFIVRNNLEFDHTKDEYHIRSPGGRIVTNQFIRDIALNLNGHIYLASPLIIHHHDIDIILEVDWMNQHEAVLDTSARTIG